jgi:hypothetical protein
MKRVTNISITTDNGTTIKTRVESNTDRLAAYESKRQHDSLVDGVVDSLRGHHPFIGAVPLRSISIK